MAAEDHDEAASSPTDTGVGAPPPTRLRVPLKTMGDVKSELARLYREGKAGRRDINEVSKLGNLLSILGRLIEGTELAARIDALEAREGKK